MKKFAAFILILVVGGTFFYFKEDILNLYSRFSLNLPEIEKNIGNVAQEIGEQISTPPPLRSTEENAQAFLTKEGVIQWTNSQREKNGLLPLKESPKLDTSAAIKAEDMLLNQYFAHESPTGVGVADLAENVGYEFIAIGENLAMGNFKDDETLVQAWMDSPGHRANILNVKYTEIGVAVEKGQFEGRTVWMAVQHFGFPVSACPKPDENIKLEIDENQSQIKKLETNLQILKIEIQSLKPRQRTIYLQKIDQYNNLVSEYNALLAETENLINEYNAGINIFNKCASGT